ncbi:hypothetical protein C5C00_01620 [Rathayibacter rathayi]|nr:hypothetical protein C5C47_00895 [Rathayibacter rathayi]PPG98747.1 hypothetical protein C5C00_01620 [Rathayibacter rathayi]
MAIYSDDRGNAMTEFALGGDWVDGHLTFRGRMSLEGKGDVGFIDDFSRPSVSAFRNTVTMEIGGHSHLHGIMDVTRTGS